MTTWVRRQRRGRWHVVAIRYGNGCRTKCGAVMRGYTTEGGGLVYEPHPPIVSSTGERRCYTCRIGIG